MQNQVQEKPTITTYSGTEKQVTLALNAGDNLIRIDETGQRFSLDTTTLFNMQNDTLNKARPISIIKLPWQSGCKPLDVIHKGT